MDTFLKFILTVLVILIIGQIIYSYITFSSFNCPDCPICPPQKECSNLFPPSNSEIIRHLHKIIIAGLEDSIDGVDFLKKNTIFANNVKIRFETDAESILSKMRTELIENKKNIIKENIKYVQTTDKVKIEDFNKQFNLTEYPSPLVIFPGTDILFGWIASDNKWKILINKNKY